MSRFRVVVIGCSLGGFNALSVVLAALPRDFNLPIVVAQHRSSVAQDLALALARVSVLPVRDAEDKELLQPGHVLLAPAGYHLLIQKDRVALSTDLPVSYARPSIDVLFESAVSSFEHAVLGIALTCSNHDGVEGARKIERAGGMMLVQDPATAEADVLPRQVLAVTKRSRTLNLHEIAATMAAFAGGGL